MKHWVNIWVEPLVLVRGVVYIPKAKALGYYMGRTSGSCTWCDGSSCSYPKAKALGYYMHRAAGSYSWSVRVP